MEPLKPTDFGFFTVSPESDPLAEDRVRRHHWDTAITAAAMGRRLSRDYETTRTEDSDGVTWLGWRAAGYRDPSLDKYRKADDQ